MTCHVPFRYISLLLLATISPATTQTPPTPPNRTLVHEHQGTLLTPVGLVGLDSNNVLISVFNKIQIPQLTTPTNCDSKWITNFNTEIQQLTSEYTTMFADIAQPNSSPIKKRSLVALGIGLGLADLLLTGISYGTLNTHINKVESKLDSFITEQHTFNKNTLEIEDDIVKFISKLQSDLNEDLKKLQCQIFSTTGKLFARELTSDWTKKVETLLKPIILGKVTTQLTPEIIAPNDLRQIISDHALLQNTYFGNVFNLYKMATLTVTHTYLDLNQGTLTVHQIIKFPNVKSEYLLPYYKVVQNTIIKAGKCFTLDLPSYVYLKKGNFYPLDSRNCPIKSLTTCLLPPLKQEMHDECLGNLNCTLHEVTCRSRFTYDTSGLLVTTTDTILAFNSNRSIQTVKTGDFGTAFLPWEHTKYVQIAKASIERPKTITYYSSNKFTIKSLNTWNDIVTTTSMNFSQKSPETLLTKIEQLKGTANIGTPTSFAVNSAISFTLVVVIAALGLAVFFIHRKLVLRKDQPTPTLLSPHASNASLKFERLPMGLGPAANIIPAL